jgi:GNAT superfamily N-acetyltransferase
MTPSLPTVRDAWPDEIATIAQITRLAYGEYSSRMEPAAWNVLEQEIESALTNDRGVTRLVAELDGVVVGSAALYAPDTAAYGNLASVTLWPEVRLVAVHPAARGRGIARALVEDCVRRARRAGARVIGLHTSETMRAAKQLYERMGFVRDPDHDFQPPGAELVEGYLLRLDDHASHPEP